MGYEELKRGFTLIELLTVVAVIGILAAIAIPNFMNAMVKAKIAKTYTNFHTLQNALHCFKMDHEAFINSNAIWDIGRKDGWEFIRLTTPISYLKSIHAAIDDFSSEEDGTINRNQFYDYLSPIEIAGRPNSNVQLIFVAQSKPGDSFLLTSLGPNQKKNYHVLINLSPTTTNYNLPIFFSINDDMYSITNGILSRGDIIATHKTIYQ